MANDSLRDRPRGGADRRDRSRDRDSYRDRDHRRGDREHTPHDRRSRSRSPRHQRGGRRSDNRYRSRSPAHRDRGRDARDIKDRGRDGRDGRDHDYRGAPPTGPRGAGRDGRDNRDRDARARSKSPGAGAPLKPPPSRDVKHAAAKVDEEDEDIAMGNTTIASDGGPPEGIDEDTWEMMKVMGFGMFKSTKETKVPGNDRNYGVRRDKKMEARQYMNRQGGFNRPLSPGR